MYHSAELINLKGIFLIVILMNVTLLNVILLSIIQLSVTLLSVTLPTRHFDGCQSAYSLTQLSVILKIVLLR